MNFPGIYKITNLVNGKIYVGQSVNIAQRIAQHFQLRSTCPHLRHAIAHYGREAFDAVVLERVDDLARLNEREQFWIDTLDACNRTTGYNIAPTAGSTRGFKHTPETRAKLRAISLSQRDKMIERLRAANLGRKHTDEWKAAQSAKTKGRPKSESTVARMRAYQGTPEARELNRLRRLGKTPYQMTADVKAKISTTLTGKPLSEERKATLRAVHGTPEARTENQRRNQERCHSLERTAALLDYIAAYPQARMCEIERDLGINRTTARGLVNRAGWYRSEGGEWVHD